MGFTAKFGAQAACRIASILLAVNSVTLAASSPAPDVHLLAQRVDRHYNRLRSLEAQFEERYRGAGIERTESGVMYLKKPGRMRWEYRSPREKLFVTDGKVVWFYVPEERQARKADFKKLEDLKSPLAFLLGKTRLEKELAGLSIASDASPLDPANVVLRGTPKMWRGRVSQVLLEVAPGGQIVRIVVDEMDGSNTEYRLTQQRENPDLNDRQFVFAPPPGVEIVSGEFGQ
jgi:outer membrane lipoprotein carrier protein